MRTIRAVGLQGFLLAGCVSSTTQTPIPPAVAQPSKLQTPDRELRVMTYNIKHGQSNASCTQPPALAGQPPSPDCNLNLAGTIVVLRAHAPDVVALQEVDRSWARSAYTDQPAVIAEALQMKHRCFAPNLDHPADSHSTQPHQYGTAIVSRFPIIGSCSHTLLTTFSGWEQRGIVGALVDVRGLPTRIYSTHLQASGTVGGASQSAAPQRVLQVQDIMKALSNVTDPIILMGDFNADSLSAEMKPLVGRLLDAGARSGNTSPARLTGDPTSRIDYVFVSPDLSIASTYVPIDAQTRLASDHYPVVSQIRPSPSGDAHENIEDNHSKMWKSTDRPIAGLLTDLKARGLLDSTLVIWGGEFGRTPFNEKGNGRDHNPWASRCGWRGVASRVASQSARRTRSG